MKEVYRFQDVILLSDKTLEKAEGNRAWFTDGSVADLDQLTFVNRGVGDIKFEWALDEVVSSDARTQVLEFAEGNEVVIQGGDLYFEVQQRVGKGTSLELIGTEHFHASVKVYETQSGVVVETPPRNGVILGSMYVNGRRVKGDPIEGKMIFRTPSDPHIYIRNNGGGIGRIDLPIALLDVRISGSMQLDCGSVATADIHIDGSGSVKVQQVVESCNVEINGSGNIQIGSGRIPKFRAVINGSGNISAAVAVQKAELQLRGSGFIWVARVIDESFELHGGAGSITVLERG